MHTSKIRYNIKENFECFNHPRIYSESIKSNPLDSIRQMFCFFRLTDYPICAYIIPNNNDHMSEYITEHDKRLKFISGFTGSAGTAIITHTQAVLWTDLRYFYQAKIELDKNWTIMKSGYPEVPTEAEWLIENIPSGSSVGCNSKLLPYPIWISLKQELEKSNIKLIPITTDFIDNIWVGRPEMPCFSLKRVPQEISGMTSLEKILQVRLKMREKKVDMLIISGLDDIAWVLNLRGSDLPYNPVFIAFLAITEKSTNLFYDVRKSHLKISNHLRKEGPVITHAYNNFYRFVKKIEHQKSIKKVWIPNITNYCLYNSIPENKRFLECSPIQLLKAVKNEVEAEGMVKANIREGVALCQFFQWLENEINHSALTEIDASEKLDQFRRLEHSYVGPSFETSSSSGPHTAMPHYTPDQNSNRLLSKNEMYLCDTGAHYEDGTTDITRTFHFGEPTEFQKICYTRVFKGLVQLSTCIFPQKIKGIVIDCLARKFLWDIGLDYGHATGHGIGCHLNVHEGPMGISWRPYPDDPGLDENMFLSNEPGFYSDGDFGVRIENIVQVVAVQTPHNFQDKTFLTFNTITKCPIQTKMLVIDLLTEEEMQFINGYHKNVLDTIGPILKKRGLLHAYEWLVKETKPIEQIIIQKVTGPYERIWHTKKVEPTAEQPGQPTAEQPGQPTAEQPGQPTVEQPTVQQPIEQPTVQQPIEQPE